MVETNSVEVPFWPGFTVTLAEDRDAAGLLGTTGLTLADRLTVPVKPCWLLTLIAELEVSFARTFR